MNASPCRCWEPGGYPHDGHCCFLDRPDGTRAEPDEYVGVALPPCGHWGTRSLPISEVAA